MTLDLRILRAVLENGSGDYRLVSTGELRELLDAYEELAEINRKKRELVRLMESAYRGPAEPLTKQPGG